MLRLGLTKVHFIPVKIGIVWVADALIQPERPPRPDFCLTYARKSGHWMDEVWTYLMAHDRQLKPRHRGS